MSRVDFCVTTLNRPQALERLLFSVAEHQPNASVHVADQSEHFDPASYEALAERLIDAGLRRRPTIHSLPFDCGIAVARNHLIDSTPGEYKLSLDDDFLFTEQTDIDALVRLLDAHSDVGVVGGSVRRKGQIRNIGTRFERHGSSLRQLSAKEPAEEDAGIRFKRIDCVPLFVLMRKDLFAYLRWDPNMKTGGAHFDFFLRIQDTPYTVLYAPDVIIDHPPIEADSSYRSLRSRSEFFRQMLIKHELTHLEVLDGTVFELRPDGELTMYCELDHGGLAQVAR